jgi:hypothetical protein
VTVLRFELRLPEPQSGVLTTRRYRLLSEAYHLMTGINSLEHYNYKNEGR